MKKITWITEFGHRREALITDEGMNVETGESVEETVGSAQTIRTVHHNGERKHVKGSNGKFGV